MALFKIITYPRSKYASFINNLVVQFWSADWITIMTRKDYIKFAAVINYNMPSEIAKPTGYKHRLEAWTNIVNGLIEVFEEDNPLFDRHKFYIACGIQD